MDRIQPLFAVAATATGGRNGHTETADGLIAADLSVPKDMGGPGKDGTATPEHLFAAGYAACFAGAVDFAARKRKQDARDARVTAEVAIGKREPTGFALAVTLRVEHDDFPQTELEEVVREAHEDICPYSHATRGNVDVKLEVKGGA